MAYRGAGALGDSSYDASIRVQRLGGGQQPPITPPTRPTATAAALPADNPSGSSTNKLNSQQAHRRQAALHQLAARSRSRSTSSSRALSKQPSRAELDQQQQQQQTLIGDVLIQDAAAARLAGDYLAAVHSAASIHSASAAASSASSWPPQSDVPHWVSEQPGNALGDQQHLDWEGMLRRGMELAHGPSTHHFLQVVDLFPEPGLGQVRTPCSMRQKLLVEAYMMKCTTMLLV